MAELSNWMALFGHLATTWWTRRGGLPACCRMQAARLAALLAHARRASPFYRALYRDVPEEAALAAYPVVTRRELMLHFDDWVTDPAVTLAGAHAFMRDRRHIGERFLDRYIVWKSSGTSGVPGVYVQDDDAMAVYDALLALQMERLAPQAAAQGLLQGSRAALVAATGDHYASVASWLRMARSAPWAGLRAFSIMDPLPRLCAALQAFAPSFLAGYPTALLLLAGEQIAGRLALRPAIVWSGGECLVPPVRELIRRAFGCPLVEEYGASECMSIAFGCAAGTLHLNADWVVLEAVDEAGLPVPHGTPSHTVLLTNLANRVQPLIRYDLGDSIVVSPTPCACGSPLPALCVAGRSDDILTGTAPDGTRVRLLPLAIDSVLEEALGDGRYQLRELDRNRFGLRLPHGSVRARRAAFSAAASALQRWLAGQGLPNVTIELDAADPAPAGASGKPRHVVARPERAVAPPRRARRPPREAC